MSQAERTAEEWGRVAVSLPEFPSSGMAGTIDTPNGEVGFGLGGLIWRRPHSAGNRLPWVLDVDHPATAGCLLALLGPGVVTASGPDGSRVGVEGKSFGAGVSGRVFGSLEDTIGRACIAAAEALGRWPGGEA